MILFLLDFLLLVSLQIDERTQLLLQNGSAATNGLFGIQGAIGLKIDDQLVKVGPLLNSCGIHGIRNATHRTEGGIQLQTTNSTRLILGAHSGIGRRVTTPASALELHLEIRPFV